METLILQMLESLVRAYTSACEQLLGEGHPEREAVGMLAKGYVLYLKGENG